MQVNIVLCFNLYRAMEFSGVIVEKFIKFPTMADTISDEMVSSLYFLVIGIRCSFFHFLYFTEIADEDFEQRW